MTEPARTDGPESGAGLLDEDRLLDHSYDGIQEYDNPLPGWWVNICWASIIFSAFYLLYYHVGVGPSIIDEYNAEAAAYYEQQAAQIADLEINEETIAAWMQEADLMAGMQLKFVSKCATCHGAQGQGDACPNLTDDHWIHGGTLMEIYGTIRDGVAGKEMKAWLDDLGPVGVLYMSAYVGTLRGTDVPGGKAPEGEPFDAAGK